MALPSNLSADRVACPSPGRAAREAVTWRSALLGLLGTIIICGVTPYNDYALNNTFMVGNHLPICIILMLFVLVIGINAPLRRWWPGQALSSGELAVALSMALVSCALPSSGLMRIFPPSLVSPWWLARTDRLYLNMLESMHLPRWIFPSFQGAGPRQWMLDPIVSGYIGRWIGPGPVPYAAWLRPAIVWGIFIFALYGALISLVTIVRQQWFENERLAFPLAQIYLSLIEEPKPGHVLNDFLSKKSFWVAFGVVFFIHGWNALHAYNESLFPEIPVYYDVLTRVLRNPPLSYVATEMKTAAIFFSIVGITYFVPSSVSISLWGFFLLQQMQRMILGQTTGDPNPHGQGDQCFGGLVAFTVAILWVGRKHWKMVLGQALRGRRAGQSTARYLSYGWAVWGGTACSAIMVLWLWMAGCTLGGAITVVVMMLWLFMLVTRVIAESGMVYVQFQVPLQTPWVWATDYGHPLISPLKTVYFVEMLQASHGDYRESMPVFASHGMKVTDVTAFSDDAAGGDTNSAAAQRRTGRSFIALLMLALLVGYGVSFFSTLWTEYTYATTLDSEHITPINQWGTIDAPYWNMDFPMSVYARGDFHIQHSPIRQFIFGMAFTSFLSWMRLRYAWWPLHPIGYLLLSSYPEGQFWLSILLGWMAKALIIRFGGPRMYSDGKPFFLGLIVGEAVAAGFWLALGIGLNGLGLSYRVIHIMPG